MKIVKVVKTAKVVQAAQVLFSLALVFGFLFSSCKGESLFDEFPDTTVSEPGDFAVLDNKLWDMEDPLNDFKTYEGNWRTENGRLNFTWWNSSAVESKFEFLDTAMANGKVEMDLTLESVRLNAGTIGFMIRSGEYQRGQDQVNGYYIAVGRDNAGQHWVEAGRMEHSWNAIWGRIKIDGTGTFHLSVEMIGGKITTVVTNKGKKVFERSFYDSWLPQGNIGFRSWQGNGYIDNVKMNNVGPGYDHAKK